MAVLKEATILLLCSALCVDVECQVHYTKQNAGLTEIPGDIPPAVTRIDLASNLITSLDKNAFSKFTELHEFDVNKNSISEIHDEAFDELPKLEKIILFMNTLVKIPKLRISTLEYLDLSNNKISIIYDSTFDALLNLTTLYLYDNNLEEIPKLRISTLKYLSFGKNKIRKINDGAFDALVNLKTLYLDNNELKAIPALPISTLEYLHLQNNKICTLNDDTFDALYSLKRLYLNNNKLESIPKLRGLHLDTLALHNNKIHQQSHDFEDLTVKTLLIYSNNITNLSAISKLSASLEQLDASSNPLGVNSAAELYASIKSLTKIQSIDLQYCGLTSFPDISQLNRNFELYIGDNPFECDCQMSWILHNSTAMPGCSEIQCASPNKHSGKFLCEISGEELCSDCGVGFYGVNCEECGHCKNDSCSYVDGHCLDGCQLWFAGDLCKEEIALPSLARSGVFLWRVNDSAVAITWTQDPQIPDKHAAYYGYTVAHAEAPGDFKDGPSVAHRPAALTQILIVANIYTRDPYYFKVHIYREMDGIKEYGLQSACVNGFYGGNCENECGQCKENSCSNVDGHCLHGCQLWFAGDLCKEKIVPPSLVGSRVLLLRVNDSAVAIMWTQDSQIPDKQAEYYGYTVAYVEGPGDFILRPSIVHKASIKDQLMIIANVQAHNEYRFKVLIYREMDGEREYGLPSDTIRMASSSGANRVVSPAGQVKEKSEAKSNSGHTNVFIPMVIIVIPTVIIILLVFSPKQGYLKQNRKSVSVEDSIAQASTLPGDTVGQPSRAIQSSQCVRMETHERRDQTYPYTAPEEVYQEIDDSQLS